MKVLDSRLTSWQGKDVRTSIECKKEFIVSRLISVSSTGSAETNVGTAHRLEA
jgi:hypothetical protein